MWTLVVHASLAEDTNWNSCVLGFNIFPYLQTIVMLYLRPPPEVSTMKGYMSRVGFKLIW